MAHRRKPGSHSTMSVPTIEFSLSRLSPDDHQHPDLFAAKTVAMQFLRDFQRHGIHLPAAERKRLVGISDEMLDVGRKFFAGTGTSARPTWVSKKEAGRLGSGFACSLEYDQMDERAELDPCDWAAHTLLQQHPEEEVRRRIWLSQRQSSSEQIGLLETLLKLRHQFARLTGKANWAEVVLEDKMAGSPENVMAFLDGLSAQNKPLALQELASLITNLPSHPHQTIIHPWDREYYLHLSATTKSKRRTVSSSNNLSSYFSVGSCLEGLSRLFSTLYGISFQVETPEGPDEVWDSSVVKLGVIDEEEGRLGTIYCDLFQREGKPAGAAHYTIRCSRRTDLDQDMLDLDFFHQQPLDHPIIDHIFPDPALSEPLHTPVTTIPGKPGTYQRPIVVFSCSFDPPDPVTRQPSLLAWSDVETLFHEMGHAIHWTRCATDYVELPSILMEHICRSAEVLELYARHYVDDRPLGYERFEGELWEMEGGSQAVGSQGQIVLAALDQHLHSEPGAQTGFDSTAVYAEVSARYAVPWSPSQGVQEDQWQARFGHLYGYGASYYAYLFDRVIAKHIWRSLQLSSAALQTPLISRHNGLRIKNHLLVHGGSKDPWLCLAHFFQNIGTQPLQPLRAGGKSALQSVAKWGLL
ncbi:hypothetical protein VP01_157g4 [Puccinia sorghi]|uniref:mitochondrial intermediate peptidase n=1 Tax=Puccinia sorghi TaxID=27349 RepID=A0A0L6VJG9_9BASI|nr:hypothetical protein VP01_157g4 [Puccinia sorghi]